MEIFNFDIFDSFSKDFVYFSGSVYESVLSRYTGEVDDVLVS